MVGRGKGWGSGVPLRPRICALPPTPTIPTARFARRGRGRTDYAARSGSNSSSEAAGVWVEIRVRAVFDALGPFCSVGGRVFPVLLLAARRGGARPGPG